VWWQASPELAGAGLTVVEGFKLGKRIFGGLLTTEGEMT
jgi:hypothetical protein